MKTAGPRRALAYGAGAALLYLALASLSAHLSPLARQPLLDGFAPPPPYRFVQPPPNLRSINKPPLSGRFTLNVHNGVATEGLFATKDSQTSILLLPRSILAPGQRAVTLTLQPLAPPKNATVPNGESITGNVYRIQATFQPSGKPVESLQKQAILTLVYPALAGQHHVRRVLASHDGVRFAEIRSIDSTVQEQVTAHVGSLGYYAVGVRAVSAPTAQPSGGSGSPVALVVVVAAIGMALLIGWLLWLERRRRGRSSRHRRPPPRRRQ